MFNYARHNIYWLCRKQIFGSATQSGFLFDFCAHLTCYFKKSFDALNMALGLFFSCHFVFSFFFLTKSAIRGNKFKIFVKAIKELCEHLQKNIVLVNVEKFLFLTNFCEFFFVIPISFDFCVRIWKLEFFMRIHHIWPFAITLVGIRQFFIWL